MRDKVFISYSHEDKDWLRRLRIHLKLLERDYGVDVWDDTKIAPGSRWREEIERAIASAKVAVLLVSANFVASDFISTNELPPLLEAAEGDGARILVVILSPSRFLRIKTLSQFQTVNDPSRPLISMSAGEQEAVLDKVAEAVENALGAARSDEIQPTTPGKQNRPERETPQPQGAVRSQSGGTLRFQNYLYPDLVSVKFAVKKFEAGGRDFTVVWPEEFDDLLTTVERLFSEAESYRESKSIFYGCDARVVASFVETASTGIATAQRIRAGVGRRIFPLLRGMKDYFDGPAKETSLSNFLTLANFTAQRGLAYALRYERVYERFFPASWQSWFEGPPLLSQYMGRLFGFNEPTCRALVSSISGINVERYFWGPESMVKDVLFKKGPINAGWFVDYLIPQVELTLVDNPERTTLYEQKALVTKVIDESGREFEPE